MYNIQSVNGKCLNAANFFILRDTKEVNLENMQHVTLQIRILIRKTIEHQKNKLF